MSHVIVWVFRELNMVQTAISVHTAIDDKAAGSAAMKIEHATFSHNRSSCRSDHRHHAYRVLLQLLFLLQVTFGPGLTKVHLRTVILFDMDRGCVTMIFTNKKLRTLGVDACRS